MRVRRVANRENASEILSDYIAKIGGRQKLFEKPTKGKKRGRQRASASPTTATKRSRKSEDHPADREPPAEVQNVFKPPAGSWEEEVVDVEMFRGDDGELRVFLTWRNGSKSQHAAQQAYLRCPQRVSRTRDAPSPQAQTVQLTVFFLSFSDLTLLRIAHQLQVADGMNGRPGGKSYHRIRPVVWRDLGGRLLRCRQEDRMPFVSLLCFALFLFTVLLNSQSRQLSQRRCIVGCVPSLLVMYDMQCLWGGCRSSCARRCPVGK